MPNPERYIQRLYDELLTGWPVRRELTYRDNIRLYRAFAESDPDILKPSGWGSDYDGVRDYVIDPLGERIPWVWSDLLYGQDPVIAPASKTDVDRMDELIDFNDLPSEYQRAEWVCSVEGEVWSRVIPNPEGEHAQIEWHSRMNVVPLWVGRKLVGAAFVSVLDVNKNEMWRYVEIHVEGAVRRLLFKGTPNGDKLGIEAPLGDHEATAEWDRDWVHGLPILVDRVPNKLGRDFKMGVSDYASIMDLLLALNELTTVGQENARLTAKQRAIIPQRFLNMAGNFPRGSEILIATEVDQDPEKLKAQVAMVEFEFDAAALVAYIEHTTDKILTRARIAPQLVGRHTEGAQTGPALRARVLDSELATQGKGKPWDDRNPHILLKGAMVEKLPTSKGGLGIKWSNTKDLPSFKRASALPEDPESLTRRLAVAVNAGMLSRKTSIGLSFPEWGTARIEDEVKQIEKEEGMNAPEPDRTTRPSPETGGEKAERRDGPNGKSRGGRSA